ncbi:hypothetical protein HDA40_003930 [Hamadaea flava]|uniref:Uncharacterized protein n=1 Tax=Hamadaea flava TaxID=1742688 RepID=A0ABV8LI10_9ACTN|nr:hypothetical protein [Hamadaea flava]MCP2325423.1 hypothetical protein [Hamadaea flava]
MSTPTERLAAVLAAAHAPAHDGERAGEEAAVEAFRERRRTHARRRAVRRVGVICAAVLATSGVAVAATAGALPQRFGFNIAAHAEHPTGGTAPNRRTFDLPTQCRRWLGLSREARHDALDRPEFRQLVDQAGADRVETFCQRYAESPTGSPRPQATGWPTPHPTPSRSPWGGPERSMWPSSPSDRPSGQQAPPPSQTPGVPTQSSAPDGPGGQWMPPGGDRGR